MSKDLAQDDSSGIYPEVLEVKRVSRNCPSDPPAPLIVLQNCDRAHGRTMIRVKIADHTSIVFSEFENAHIVFRIIVTIDTLIRYMHFANSEIFNITCRWKENMRICSRRITTFFFIMLTFVFLTFRLINNEAWFSIVRTGQIVI